jgi:hypothetical protein
MTNDRAGSDKLKSALCYIPLAWLVIFFIEKDKSPYLIKHIKYWTVILIIFIIIRITMFAVMLNFLAPLLWLWYIGISVFLWYKAYNWEWIELEFIDNNEIITKAFKENKKKDVKKEDNKDVLDWDNQDSKIKTNNYIVDKVASWAGKVAQWAKNKVQEEDDDDWDEEEWKNKNEL